ncbi:MAG: 3-hydroxyacyl-[acyl-carrier-protein] dehydratase FabZ [Candidatus Aminicenantes bacterium RBG_13_62_12]|nr:MAG: 3-hydroxyacyl-[acyl-carrier-protein] dehydratase FabZ [Candidatus Aminicenantes bacterium RBG_13_62_12]
MSIEEILTYLPHRYPFLLVDRVLEMEKGRRILALKNVTYNEPFFQGHFPDLRIMPGVLIVEALAQAAGILIYNSIEDPRNKLVFLSKIDRTKFRKPVIPGDQLRLDVDLIKLKTRFFHVAGKAYVGEALVAETEAMGSLVSLEEMHEPR